MNASLSILLTLLFLSAAQALSEVVVPKDLEFIFRDQEFMSPDRNEAWYRQLRETPGIGDRLCDLLWECYKDPPNAPGSGIGAIIAALAERDDISPPQLKKITDEMRRLAKDGMAEAIKNGVEGLLLGVCILERYPSDENEDLALLLLRDDNELLRNSAANTLGRIGTRRSVEPIRNYFDRFRNIKTEPPNDGHQVFEAEQMLLARVAMMDKQGIRGEERLPPKQSDRQQAVHSFGSFESELSNAPPWIMWPALLAATLGLCWFALKRSMR